MDADEYTALGGRLDMAQIDGWYGRFEDIEIDPTFLCLTDLYAAADNAYMLGDERERGMYDGYGAVMRRCLELPEANVEDWIYGFTHAIRESGDADTEYARGCGIAMDCVIWSLGPTGRELRDAIEKRLGGE